MLLAFDTTLDICSVALLDSAGVLAAHISKPMTRGHAEALVPMIDQALADAGAGMDAVRRVGVTIGPGTFTGVRVGISAARGLALALGVPVAGIGTLEMLAAGAAFSADLAAGSKILATIDARRGQAYLALYRVAAPEDCYPLCRLAEPAAVALEEAGAWLGEHAGPEEKVVAVGSAAGLLDGRLFERIIDVGPDAATVARLAAALPQARWDEKPRALYLRPPDAKLPANVL